jgi:Sugar kinases, ribokinase family
MSGESDAWRSRPVVGLGLVNIDFVAVAERVERDEKTTARHYFEQVGGPVPVALTAMARLGLEAPPVALGVVGDDRAGDDVRRLLTEDGVDASLLARAEATATSRSLVLLDARDGTRTLANHAADLPSLVLSPAQEAAIRRAGLLHLDGRDLPACLAAARIARAAGALVSIDLGTARPGREALLALCDIILASRKGGAGMFPEAADDPEEQVRRFLALGARVAGVTLAHEGVVVAARDENGGKPVRLPAYLVEKPADTCGAGDTFHGGFLWAYRAGRSATDAADFAQATVALRIRKYGNRAGLPIRADVERFLLDAGARP